MEQPHRAGSAGGMTRQKSGNASSGRDMSQRETIPGVGVGGGGAQTPSWKAWPSRDSRGDGGACKEPEEECPDHAHTCLTVVAEETLWADAQVGPATVLALSSVLAGAGVAGIHLWRTPKEWARAAKGCLGEGGEDSGKKGKGGVDKLGVEVSLILGGCPALPSPLESCLPGNLSNRARMAAPSALLSEWPRVWAFRKQFCLGVWGISSVGEGLGTQGIHPSIAPTCLAVDSSEACGALAHKGSWEVPTGASVSAGLRLALICLCKDRTWGCMSLPTPHGPNGPIGPHMVLYGLTWTYMTSRVLCSA